MPPLDHPSPVVCCISCQSLTDHARSPSPPLTPPLTAPNLHGSSASLPHRHSHFIQPPSDRPHQSTAVSFYPPHIPPTDASRPLSDPEPSGTSLPSSMIVSGLSFYDPAHASNVPDYQRSGWPASFDPSFSSTTGNPFTARDSAFNPASSSNSGAASAGAQGFQFLSNPTEFDVHRRSPLTRQSRLPHHPTQSHHQRIHRRQIVSIPRQQPGLRHDDPTEGHGQFQTRIVSSHAQTEEHERRNLDDQVIFFFSFSAAWNFS